MTTEQTDGLDEIETPPTNKRRLTRKRVGAVLEAAGGLSVSAAGFGVSTLIGLVTLGVCLIVFGVATELGGN